MNREDLDRLCVDTIRFLAVDTIQKADSGHPGLPLDAAPMAYVLWTRFLRHDPNDPTWWDRDRFVLSAGHGSALLYALLHLTGYDLPMEELKRFRQWDSRTPGHPEYGRSAGVDATTGPLGQGLSNALGMAMAEAHLAARYNRPGFDVFDHRTYVLASDGDLMEGVASEASSLAGHYRLGKLVVLYDDNHVTLSGSTPITFTEDVARRYEAYGWHVQRVEDGNDLPEIDVALERATDEATRPSLIMVRTEIGYGSPHKEGTFAAHGSPLGPDEVAATKRNLGWPEDARFFVPDEAAAHLGSAVARGGELHRKWQDLFDDYGREHGDLAREIGRRFQGRLPDGWTEDLPRFDADAKGLATRKSAGAVLQSIASRVVEVVGGSGDLDPSTHTKLAEEGDFESPDREHADVQGAAGGHWGYDGRNVHFGVREHAMAAAVNGMAYHGGFVPFGATFLAFSDYMRPAIRLAALSELRCIFVFTHDSIALGEDGPTHQSVGQLASLRAIPNLLVIRPGDANEVRVAWQVAMEQTSRPVTLVLTRQAVPTLDRARFATADGLRRGAYVLNPDDAGGRDPEVILMATGSEVSLIVAAAQRLRDSGVRVRLVSMPCWELFEEQDADYRERVLPARVTARVAVEAASPMGWGHYVGSRGAVIAVNRFGASAPGEVVMREYGFTPEHVVRRAREVMDS
ncbi:MAG: transketolase [Gemmatimonadetes bacterium]|nr:transketolase [Gemmatimonadota bacterium]